MRSILLAALLLASPAAVAQKTFSSSAGPLRVETVARGLVHPWSLAFLPDSRMLVTERPGRMRIVTRDGKLSQPLAGVPKVYAHIFAGLMDVILARDFARSREIFFCYDEPYKNGGRTAVARARLQDDKELASVTIIFHERGPVGHGFNTGCRIVQGVDGDLFVTFGDQGDHGMFVQLLDNDIGKIIRIKPDGSVPTDNPFIGRPGALPEIWAYGLRDAEGLAFNPWSGQLWEQEHGPKGGDEINIIRKGGNYGWPVVSFGVNYNGTPVGRGEQQHAGMIDPIWHWTPSIAPSGMAFYTGTLLPGWQGSLFNGALKFELVARLTLDGDYVVKEERILQGLHERIRDVRQGPDGALYLLTDNEAGRVLRVTPAN
jgi:aldose sugar dehydrogenase